MSLFDSMNELPFPATDADAPVAAPSNKMERKSLFRRIQLRKSRTHLPVWIFQVAHNLALKQRIANKGVRDKMDTGELIADQQYLPSPTPKEHLSAALRQRHLLAIVNTLPLDDLNCLRLRAEDLRYREIASVLGISREWGSPSLTRSLARPISENGR
jgi:hypothetical protein